MGLMDSWITAVNATQNISLGEEVSMRYGSYYSFSADCLLFRGQKNVVTHTNIFVFDYT